MMDPMNQGSQANPPGDRAPQEMTIMDWIKALLHGDRVSIPESAKPLERLAPERPRSPLYRQAGAAAVPQLPVIQARHLRTPIGLLLALMAQLGLATRTGPPFVHIAIYLAGAAMTLWGMRVGDFSVGDPKRREQGRFNLRVRPQLLLIGLAFGALTFFFGRSNQFNPPTIVFWLASLASVVLAFWEGELWSPDLGRLRLPRMDWEPEAHHVLFFALIIVAVWFRFVRLDTVPFEMWSDHAEKLLDVGDILDGSYPIFFVRNTGREPFQFYLAALTARLAGTGLSYMTLKLGTALAGLLTLPFLYLYAREVGGRATALAAFGLAAISAWPNIISRVGLRFPLLAVFAAPALYYMARGLKRGSRNDFILSGLAVGVGLNGYSPARIVPLVILLGVLVYALHRHDQDDRLRALVMLTVAGLVAAAVILPLAGYTSTEPQNVLFRMMSRVGQVERAFPGSPWGIFLKNFLDSLGFFGWDNGELWVISNPNRPALDWVTGALFHLGVILLIVRYVRRRDWLDLFTLLSIPVLMLPSTLSLAFPVENPAPHRASGAIVPAFTIAGLTVSGLYSWARRTFARRGVLLALGAFGGVLFLTAAAINYRLVFVDWNQRHLESTWNTRAAGEIIRGFDESIGDWQNAFVIPYPYWMDTRLVGITAGLPGVDFALQPEAIVTLGPLEEPYLFLLHPDDEESAATLEALYPAGRWERYKSSRFGKDFLLFFTPGDDFLTPQDLGGALP